MTYAKDFMTTELIVATPTMTIEEAIKLLVNNRITGMPVVNKRQQLVGVVSEYDIIRAIDSFDAHKPLDLSRTIKYSKRVSSITADTSLPSILKYFAEKKVRRLPVVNSHGKLVGIITRRDIMRILFYRSKTLR